MSSNTGCARSVFGAIVVLVLISSLAFAQDSSTGNVSGTVTGLRGASVSGADLTITNKITGQSAHTTTSPAGTYAVRDLIPGEYVLRVEAKGFQPAEILVRIQAAATATGDVKLQRVVAPSAKLVDTETTEIRGSVDSPQMEQIPTDRGFFGFDPARTRSPSARRTGAGPFEEQPLGDLDRRPQWPHHPHASGWFGYHR